MKRLFLGLLLVAAPIAAHAAEFAGRYAGPNHEVRLREMDRRLDPGFYEVTIRANPQAGSPACGELYGRSVPIDARRATVLMRFGNSGPTPRRYCDVLLRLQGRTLHLEEGEGCTEWRGPSCSFTGTLTLR